MKYLKQLKQAFKEWYFGIFVAPRLANKLYQEQPELMQEIAEILKD